MNVRKRIVVNSLVKKFTLSCLLILFSIIPVYASSSDTVTAQFEDANLKDVLNSLSNIASTPLIMSGKLEGKVTAHFSNVPFETVLDQLAQTFNFTWANMSGTIIVAPAKEMATTVKTFKVKYLDLNNLKAKIALFVENGKIAINSDDSTITVDTTPTNVRKIQSIIDSEDNPPRQVLIQARMVELAKDDVEKLGLTYEWNSYSQGTAFNLGLKATLAANATLEHSKLISHPSILAYNGRKAIINLSDKVPILSTTSSSSTTTVTADYKDVGVMLEVTPIVNQDNTESITMDVHPTVSVITGTTTLNNSSYPTISSREAKTTVRMKNNETLIIGGLLKEDDVRNITKIPILGNLPIIGQLFQYHKNEKIKKEIVIFITPHIIDGSEQTTNNNIENAPVVHR